MIFRIKPIGVIHSPFRKRGDPKKADTSSTVGEVDIFKEFVRGLRDIDGFSHIICIWGFHKAHSYNMIVKPPHSRKRRGLFATRSPHRPSRLGITVLRLVARKGSKLKVKGVDMIDGSPVFDIKPYTRRDRKWRPSFGWIDEKNSK